MCGGPGCHSPTLAHCAVHSDGIRPDVVGLYLFYRFTMPASPANRAFSRGLLTLCPWRWPGESIPCCVARACHVLHVAHVVQVHLVDAVKPHGHSPADGRDGIATAVLLTVLAGTPALPRQRGEQFMDRACSRSWTPLAPKSWATSSREKHSQDRPASSRHPQSEAAVAGRPTGTGQRQTIVAFYLFGMLHLLFKIYMSHRLDSPDTALLLNRRNRDNRGNRHNMTTR